MGEPRETGRCRSYQEQNARPLWAECSYITSEEKRCCCICGWQETQPRRAGGCRPKVEAREETAGTLSTQWRVFRQAQQEHRHGGSFAGGATRGVGTAEGFFGGPEGEGDPTTTSRAGR